MHTLISSNKFKAAWSRLDAAEHGDRMAAFEGIRRLLAAQGLTLDQLLECAVRGAAAKLEQPTSPELQGQTASAQGKPNFEQTFAGFGDIFARMRATRQSNPTFRAAPRPKRILQGGEIPNTIVGTVTIDEIRPTSYGRMAVISVEDASQIFSPIVAFDSDLISKLQEAQSAKAPIRATLVPPGNKGSMPKMVNASVMSHRDCA